LVSLALFILYLQTDELLGRFAIALHDFGKLMFYYDHVPIMLLYNYCS
jgi:CRISPR/Cas system-associated endonuclease Cas3-HD